MGGDNAYTHMERIGQVAERDGFIEIPDENWQTLARLVDGDGLSLMISKLSSQVLLKHGKQFQIICPQNSGQSLRRAPKIHLREWDNILVFDANGALIGRVGVWEHTNEWTNYNDGADDTVENNSINFNFNDDDWNNIGRYEVRTREYTEKDGEPRALPLPTRHRLHLIFLYAVDATALSGQL